MMKTPDEMRGNGSPRRIAPVLLVAALLLLDLAGNAVAAPPAGDSAREPVRVAGCRVKLIDQVVLASELTGVLAEVAAEEGDRVEQGQVTARLRDTIAAAALATAEQQAGDQTAVRYARKARELADVEFEKTRQLYGKNVVTELEYRRARLDAERAALQIEKAESELIVNGLARDEKQAQLDAYRIAAPFAGVVTRVLRRPGEAVRQGDPILELVSTRRVRVEGYVEASQAQRLQPGSPVEVRVAEPPRAGTEPEVFTGRVVFVDVSVEPNTQTVRVWAEVDNPAGRLQAGRTAEMTIHPESAPPVQTARRSARDQ